MPRPTDLTKDKAVNKVFASTCKESRSAYNNVEHHCGRSSHHNIQQPIIVQSAGSDDAPLQHANSHANTNLPILLAGGGFRHAGHLAFDRQRNYPLPNLFVSMLQRMGIETDRFATSTGTMRGLES